MARQSRDLGSCRHFLCVFSFGSIVCRRVAGTQRRSTACFRAPHEALRGRGPSVPVTYDTGGPVKSCCGQSDVNLRTCPVSLCWPESIGRGFRDRSKAISGLLRKGPSKRQYPAVSHRKFSLKAPRLRGFARLRGSWFEPQDFGMFFFGLANAGACASESGPPGNPARALSS